MKYSKHITNMVASPIRKLIPYAEAVEAKGTEVIHLNIGQPDIRTPHNFLDAVRAVDISVLEYANSRGIQKTLETTQLYLHNYGIDFDLDELVITNGASEALSFLFSALCDPGDAILLIEPFYANYKSIAQVQSIEIVPVTTTADNHFRIPSLDAFEAVHDDRIRAVLLSSPSNPTGRVYTREELQTIVDYCKKHDLFLIADEVYREFNFTDRPFVSFSSFAGFDQNLILVDSISKKYSACGARIGSIASKNKELMGHVMKLCQTRLSVSTLDQIGAGAMDLVDDAYVEENRTTYKKRRDVLQERLEKLPGVIAPVPEGAFYNILKLPVADAEDFVIWTLQNVEVDGYTVLLTPAESFYETPGLGKNEIRISYCVNEEKINHAMDVLELALKTYPKILKEDKASFIQE